MAIRWNPSLISVPKYMVLSLSVNFLIYLLRRNKITFTTVIDSFGPYTGSSAQTHHLPGTTDMFKTYESFCLHLIQDENARKLQGASKIYMVRDMLVKVVYQILSER